MAYHNALRNRVLNEAVITITVPTVGDERFSTCGGEKTVTIGIQNSTANPLTGVQAALDLSALPGFAFTGTISNVSGGTVAVANAATPSFNLSDLAGNATLTFDLGIEVGCEINAVIAGGSNGGFSVDVTYNEGGGSSTAGTGSLDIVKPAFSIPNMTGNGGSGATFDAYLGLTDSMSVTLANAGNGSLTGFTYFVVSYPDLRLDAVRVGDSTLQMLGTSGDTTFFDVPVGVLKYAAQNAGSPTNDDQLFQFNETLDFREVYTVLNCSSNAPDLYHGAFYGCDGAPIPNCDGTAANSGVRFGFARPVLNYGLYKRELPACTGEEGPSFTYFLTNTGVAPASNIKVGFRYFNLGTANYDTTRIFYRIGQLSPNVKISPVQGFNPLYRAANPGQYASCANDQEVRMFRIELPVVLQPGDTLYVQNHHKPSCQCNWGYGQSGGTSCSFGYTSDAMATNSTDPYNTYQDPCGTNTYQINQVNGSDSPRIRMSTFSEGGKQINGGQVATSTYTSDYFWSNFHGTNYLRDAYPNRTIEFKFVIGNGLDWTGTDGDLGTAAFEFVDRDGDPWPPAAVEYTDHDGGPDTLVVRYTGQHPGNFARAAGALKKLTYVADCDETGPACNQGGNTTIQDYALFYPNYDNCTTCPYNYLECPGSQSIQVNCPTCDPCEGLLVHESVTNRVSFGFPDNDNNRIPDGNGPADTIDLTKVALKRLVPGDTVLTSVHASFHTSAAHPQWENATLSLNFATNYNIVPVDGQITWLDNSTGTTYTHDLLEQFPDGTRFITNVSPDKLRDLGATVPAGVYYEQGDSIWVDIRYQVLATGLGGTVYEINLDENHHAAHDVYANNPTEYKCNNYDDRINMVGITHNSYSGLTSTFGGCSVSNYGVGTRTTDHWGAAGIDYFPREVRPAPRRVMLAKLVKPSELEWIALRWRQYQKPGWTYMQTQTDIPLTNPNITVQEDTIWFDIANYIADQGNVRGDGGEHLYIFGRLRGTCETEVGAYRNRSSYTLYYEQDPLLYGTPTYIYESTNNAGNITYNGGADLQVQFDAKSQPLYSETACFEISMLNPTNNLASYSFLNIVNPTGNVVIKSLTETTGNSNTLITPTLGIYQLGDTYGSTNGTSRQFELCVSSNNCNTDSLYVAAGWDCGGYPTTVEEAVCAIPDTLYLTTVDAELAMEVSSPDTEVAVNMCEDTTYVVKLSSSLLGRLHDINLELAMPTGADYVPGSFEIAYPPPFSGDFADATWEPAADPTLLYGGTYHINVSEQDTYLDEDGMPGTTDIGQNFAFVRFGTVTTCGYTSGARVGFTSWAYNSCGELTNYRYSPSDPVEVTGASTNLKTSSSINNASINGCGNDAATFDVSYNILPNSDPSDAGDSVMIQLPAGVFYVVNSFTPGANAATGEPFIETRDGVQTLFWNLPSGLNSGDAGGFSFDVASADAGQACLSTPVSVYVISTEPVSCPGGPAGCTTRVVSSSAGGQLSVVKPIYTLAWVSADAVADPADSVLLSYAIAVNNTGTELRTGDSLIVRLFGDEGDGDYGPGDTYLGELPFDVAIAANTTDTLYGSIKVPAGTTCNLMAVVDRTRTCACENSTSPRRQATLDMDFQTAFETCSDTPLPGIGPAPLNNVTYEWIGLAGVSTAKLSSTTTTPVTFQHKNTTGTQVTFQYALRAIQGGECFAYDTVNIRIKSETYDSVTMVRCANADFSLVGPPGSNYSWTPAARVDTATNRSPFVAGGVSEPTLFAVDYTDAQGCPARQVSMVNLTNCAGTGVGDTLWFDNNNNGRQDIGEPPVVGATVNLYTNGNTTVPYATTTTDANGYYLFSNIPAGNYRVGFEPTPGTRPTTYRAVGVPEEDNSDMDTLTYLTEAVYVPNGSTNTTLDAGYLQCVITVNEAYTECSNNGTAVDASDDFFQINIVATSIYGGTSDRYVVEQNGVILNPGGTPYGKQARVNANGAFAADGVSTYTLVVRDMSYTGGCQEIIITPPTPGCSDCPVRFCLPVETTKSVN